MIDDVVGDGDFVFVEGGDEFGGGGDVGELCVGELYWVFVGGE